jgi:hypothetical protein
VGVDTGVGVSSCCSVGLAVAVGTIAVGGGGGVALGTGGAVATSVGVAVGGNTTVSVAVGVDTALAVGDGVGVAVGVSVSSGVLVGVAVVVGVGVAEGVAVAVGVGFITRTRTAGEAALFPWWSKATTRTEYRPLLSTRVSQDRSTASSRTRFWPPIGLQPMGLSPTPYCSS